MKEVGEAHTQTGKVWAAKSQQKGDKLERSAGQWDAARWSLLSLAGRTPAHITT